MTGVQAAHELTVREMEIANLEHELRFLRESHANLEKWSRIVVWPSFVVMCCVVLALGIYGIVAGEMLAVGLSFAGIVFLALVGLGIWNMRVIDLISDPSQGGFDRSYATSLERKIVDRERRLAALKGMP